MEATLMKQEASRCQDISVIASEMWMFMDEGGFMWLRRQWQIGQFAQTKV